MKKYNSLAVHSSLSVCVCVCVCLKDLCSLLVFRFRSLGMWRRGGRRKQARKWGEGEGGSCQNLIRINTIHQPFLQSWAWWWNGQENAREGESPHSPSLISCQKRRRRTRRRGSRSFCNLLSFIVWVSSLARVENTCACHGFSPLSLTIISGTHFLIGLHNASM